MATSKTPLKLSAEQQEEFFGEILHLYDLADNVVNAVGLEGITNRKAQMDLVIPFITRVNQSADKIAEVYTKHFKQGGASEMDKTDLERAFQEIFIATRDFVDAAEKL